MPGTTLLIITNTVSFIAGGAMTALYYEKRINKNIPQLRYIIAAIITTIWVIHMLNAQINPNISPDFLLHGLMGAIVTALFRNKDGKD